MKIRAIIDTGCTNSVMSKGLYDHLQGLTLSPTNNTFRGVHDAKEKYNGIIAGLPIRLSDKLQVNLNVSVVPNPEKFFLLGNDCIGGCHSKLTRLSSSDAHTFIVL